MSFEAWNIASIMDFFDYDKDFRLVKFFVRALQDVGSVSPTADSYCLQRLQDAYSFQTMRGGTSRIEFDSEAMRSAYIYKYGPCFAGAVSEHFRSLLDGNQVLRLKTLSKETLTLTCLGGGPLTEVVGIVVGLDEIFKDTRCVVPRMTIRIFVIDIERRWEETAKKITVRLPELAKNYSVDLEYSFVQQNLTEPLSEQCKAALKDADFTTMVKVMSAIYGAQSSVDAPRMIQDIVSCLSEDGALFLLDSTGFLQYSYVKNLISSYRDMAMIYEKSQNCYRLSKASTLYRKIVFSKDMRAAESHNNVHVWEKLSVLPL